MLDKKIVTLGSVKSKQSPVTNRKSMSRSTKIHLNCTIHHAKLFCQLSNHSYVRFSEKSLRKVFVQDGRTYMC